MTTPAPAAFHLDAAPGRRFALHYAPAAARARGGVVYVHPFAEEMNKARRMAALQARAFAQAGLAVLQVDLYGCGDSDGEFAEARWDIWRDDVSRAARWLAARVDAPLHVFGLRAGALLALDAWRAEPAAFRSALLWQPVVDGASHLAQFLRIAVARDALRDATKATTAAPRARLAAGESVEVAGYALHPALAAALEAQRLAGFALAGARVHWLDVRARDADAPPATASALAALREQRVDVAWRAVIGEAFWATVEIAEAPALVAASTALYAD